MSESRIRFFGARVMFGANVLGAGVPGLIITAFPHFARTEFFQNDPEPLTFGMLGAIWLSIGIVSVFGLRDPERFLGVFAVQAVYKTIWVLTGATALWNVHPEAPAYGIGFGLLAIGFAGALMQAWRRPGSVVTSQGVS
ncbi:MAG: hypothetical protein AAF211_29905 [Myxococcota bacterium]